LGRPTGGIRRNSGGFGTNEKGRSPKKAALQTWLRGRATGGTCSCGAGRRDTVFQGVLRHFSAATIGFQCSSPCIMDGDAERQPSFLSSSRALGEPLHALCR